MPGYIVYISWNALGWTYVGIGQPGREKESQKERSCEFAEVLHRDCSKEEACQLEQAIWEWGSRAGLVMLNEWEPRYTHWSFLSLRDREEFCSRMSEKMRRWWSNLTPERRDCFLQKLATANCRPETRKRRSEAATAAHRRPEVQQHLQEAYQRPEVKQRKSESARVAHARPGMKETASALQKTVQSRPESVSRHSSSRKLWWANLSEEQRRLHVEKIRAARWRK